MDMDSPKFDIYQGKVAPNCYKNYTKTRCPDFFQKKVLSDDRSEIRLFSTGQSMRALKKNKSRFGKPYKIFKVILKILPMVIYIIWC